MGPPTMPERNIQGRKERKGKNELKDPVSFLKPRNPSFALSAFFAVKVFFD
jgi:hypothetical protein